MKKKIFAGVAVLAFAAIVRSKKAFLFLISFVVLLLISCTQEKQGSVIDLFDHSQSLSYNVFELHDSLGTLLHPAALEVYDDLMVVLDVRASQLFSMVDLNSKKLVKKWGNVGQGPGEFIGVLDFYRNYSNMGINAWDPLLKKLNFCSYDSIENQAVPQFVNLFQNIKNPKMLEMFYPNILQLSDSTFLTLGNSHEKRFSFLNISANSIQDMGDYPSQDTKQGIIPMLRNKAYNGMIRLNSQLNKVVYMSRHSEMFEIYNVDGKGIQFESGNYTTIPEYQQTNEGGPSISIDEYTNRIGKNMALSVSTERIFILYQRYPEANSVKSSLSNVADIVLTFDWDGKPLQMYKLNIGVENICFDKQNNRLYAICSNPEPEIIYFDLTKSN